MSYGDNFQLREAIRDDRIWHKPKTFCVSRTAQNISALRDILQKKIIKNKYHEMITEY